MRIILHADDFGYDVDTVHATIELLECGALSSVSIMSAMPASHEAIDYATRHPEHSYGVHLTFVDGLQPVLKRDDSSLLNDEGLFYPSNEVRKKAIKLQLRKEDIIDESLAQIELVKQEGISISHLDSHGHLHKFPSFLIALPGIMKQSGIKKVRRVQNVFLQKPSMTPTSILNRCFDWWISHKFETTDYFYMSANNMDSGWTDDLLSQINKLPQDAILEIGVHPGHSDDKKELWRITEFNDVLEFSRKVREQGIHQFITWKEV